MYCVYIHIYTYTYIYTCKLLYVYIYIHIYTHISFCGDSCGYVSVCVCVLCASVLLPDVWTSVFFRSYMVTGVCVCVLVFVCLCVCLCVLCLCLTTRCLNDSLFQTFCGDWCLCVSFGVCACVCGCCVSVFRTGVWISVFFSDLVGDWCLYVCVCVLAFVCLCVCSGVCIYFFFCICAVSMSHQQSPYKCLNKIFCDDWCVCVRVVWCMCKRACVQEGGGGRGEGMLTRIFLHRTACDVDNLRLNRKEDIWWFGFRIRLRQIK